MGIRRWYIVGEDDWYMVGANPWYIVGEDRWYMVAANSWYMIAEEYWYIVARGLTAIQFSGFLHQRILILCRFANHQSIRSTTQRRAGKLASPGIGQSSTLGSLRRRRCLIWD